MAFNTGAVSCWNLLGAVTSHSTAHRAYLPFPMSIRAYHPVCPRAIFPVRVPLLPSGMLYITNILARYQNNTPFYLELNLENVGEGSLSIRPIILEVCTCKFEKLPISRKLDIWSLLNGPNINLGSQNAPTIASAEHSSRAIRWSFPLSSTTLNLKTQWGRVAPSPPPRAVKDDEMASAGEG